MLYVNNSITATFVALGVLENRSNKVYTAWGQGAIELHSVFVQIGDLLGEIVSVAEKECDVDFPGVFDYEVSEPLGGWLGNLLVEGWVFSSKEIYEYALMESVKFFCKDKTEFEVGKLYGFLSARIPRKEITW